MFQQQKKAPNRDTKKRAERKHVKASTHTSSNEGIHMYDNLYSAVPRQALAYTEDIAVPSSHTSQVVQCRKAFLRKGLFPAPDPDERNHWVRNITGGGANTFSSKRNMDASLRTDMKNSEYDSLESLTGSFYDAAENLSEIAPRMHKLMLYRGIRIPRIEEGTSKDEIERIVSRYSDVIPSSASWDMATPQDFSNAGEGQDGVIFHMIVPTDFPLVMLSYPKRADEGDPISLDIPGQQEVLVGASEFSSVRLLQIETQGDFRCYHMQVTLRAVPRGKVFDRIDAAREAARPVVAPARPVIRDEIKCTKSVVPNTFGKTADELENNEIYEHKNYPGVRYRYLGQKGIFYVFNRIDETE